MVAFLEGVVPCFIVRKFFYGLAESASKCVRMWRELLGSGSRSCSFVPEASLDVPARTDGMRVDLFFFGLGYGAFWVGLA